MFGIMSDNRGTSVLYYLNPFRYSFSVLNISSTRRCVSSMVSIADVNGLRWSPKTGQVVKIEFCS
jgi:hypothetical protein